MSDFFPTDADLGTLPNVTLRPLRVAATGAATPATDWFSEFYLREADFVRRAVMRLGGPSADADDLTQEVFLVAHRRWPEVEGKVEPRAWLYGVSLRVVAQARRKAKVRRFLGLSDPSDSVSPETPASALERRQLSQRVYRLVDSLPERKRAVLLLFELEGLSGEAIAEILGCPVQTVWTRLFHARKAFERALHRDEARLQREGEASETKR